MHDEKVIIPLLSLVGAGPGDPELITLKGVKALGLADVILYDALANDALLQYAKEGCITQYVGKKYGCLSPSQDEINELIGQFAFSHGHVVRLKGGDPFVYGRAQEEIEFAQKLGIPVNIIPGISSALAVPATRMIPLTSRGVAESFWVTTGTNRKGSISSDIKLAAQSTATVIILMAMSKLAEIMEIFIHYGRSETPVAIIQNGTTDKEKMAVGTVSDIAHKAADAAITNPAIIIVGEVVNINFNQVKELARSAGVSNK